MSKEPEVSKEVLAIILSCAKATVMNPDNIHDIHVYRTKKNAYGKIFQLATFIYKCDNKDYYNVQISTQGRPGKYNLYVDANYYINVDPKHIYDNNEFWYDDVEAFYAWVKSGERF